VSETRDYEESFDGNRPRLVLGEKPFRDRTRGRLQVNPGENLRGECAKKSSNNNAQMSRGVWGRE